ncbi:MAG: tripartite tricarboxylate transporter TctB family protein, partial [Glaciimonas sp.]|nr:tripartite tricarboxylate transporter TctB family protein [Glaciimonas sp.]
VYPLLLAVLMVLCYLRLLQKPSEKTADTPSWPRGATLVRLLLMTTYLFAYALLFQWLGFTISTALLGIGLGRLFGGRWLYCIVGSVLMGIGLFYLFDRVLDVTLPLGDVVEPVLTVLGMN